MEIIDQTRLPHAFVVARLETLADAAVAIRNHAGSRRAADRRHGGLWSGARRARRSRRTPALDGAYETLLATRPTAVNLRWALDDVMRGHRASCRRSARAEAAYRRAAEICDEDVAINDAIGEHGLALMREAWRGQGQTRPASTC